MAWRRAYGAKISTLRLMLLLNSKPEASGSTAPTSSMPQAALAVTAKAAFVAKGAKKGSTNIYPQNGKHLHLQPLITFLYPLKLHLMVPRHHRTAKKCMRLPLK